MPDKNKQEKKEKKSNLKKVIIAILFLLIVFGVGFGVYVYTSKGKSLAKGNKTEQVKEIENENLPLGDDFLINLSDEGKGRFLKTNIIVSYNTADKEFEKNKDKNVPVLRDATINYLKGKKSSEIEDLEVLKKELKDILNKSLNLENTIQEVYFQSLIIQ